METTTIRLGGRFQPTDAFLTALSSAPPIFFDVPAAKRLTIESVSAEAYFPQGQGASVRLLIKTKGKPATPPLGYQIPLYHQAYVNVEMNPQAELRDVWAMNHSLRAYIEPGVRLQLDAFRGKFQHGIGGVEIVITGFFEDVA
jgi:hypothetical protein